MRVFFCWPRKSSVTCLLNGSCCRFVGAYHFLSSSAGPRMIGIDRLELQGSQVLKDCGLWLIDYSHICVPNLRDTKVQAGFLYQSLLLHVACYHQCMTSLEEFWLRDIPFVNNSSQCVTQLKLGGRQQTVTENQGSGPSQRCGSGSPDLLKFMYSCSTGTSLSNTLWNFK